MSDGTKEKTRGLVVEISPDKMSAWLLLADPSVPDAERMEQAVEALTEAEVPITEELSTRIEDYLGQINGADGDAPNEKCLIAEGRPPVEGENGRFVWDESFDQLKRDWGGDATVNHYDLSSIVTVKKDQKIGTLVPPVPGAAGSDVLGHTIAPETTPTPVELDATVLAGKEDASEVFAATDGRVVYEDNQLSISEVVTIAADVDFSTGNFDSTVDVHILGTVIDHFEVTSTCGISVDGAVESATLRATGDITVRHGIVQLRGGSVRTDGTLVAKFAGDAQLHAGEDIRIARELMNCHVHCRGKLLVSAGSIIGGEVYARNGAEVGVIGSDAGVTTKVTVGVDPAIVVELEGVRRQIKTKREASQKIRQAVQPLMADLKRLSASQKERATELLFTADEFDAQISEAEKKCEETLGTARATDTPYVLAARAICPGVRIQIGRRETVFSKELKGAVRIEKRKMGNVTEFVAINMHSGSITILPSSYVVGMDPSDSSKPAE